MYSLVTASLRHARASLAKDFIIVTFKLDYNLDYDSW